MCMMFSQCNTCAMVIYFTIQYQGGCGHIEGHALLPNQIKFYIKKTDMKDIHRKCMLVAGFQAN